jgi:hypothetical protein
MRKERKKKENGMKMPFDIYFSPPGIYTKGLILEKTVINHGLNIGCVGPPSTFSR